MVTDGLAQAISAAAVVAIKAITVAAAVNRLKGNFMSPLDLASIISNRALPYLLFLKHLNKKR
jgi:hypothetical protein